MVTVPNLDVDIYVFFRREKDHEHQNAALEMFIQNNARLLGFYDRPGKLEIRDEVTGEALHIRGFRV
jgi:hypothetical protein